MHERFGSDLNDQTSLSILTVSYFFHHCMNDTSRPAVGPTQPPLQRVQGALLAGVKRSGREADQSPPSSAPHVFMP
jgi:hypothetical protein